MQVAFRLLTLALTLAPLGAWAQSTPAPVPERRIPPTVLAELRALDNRFETALYNDCAPERCFAKGCTYGEHAVADRPKATALPGLSAPEGPGSVPEQEYLTLARCTYAYEPSLGSRNAAKLTKRLRTKLSNGWTQVEVAAERLAAIPASLREAPEPPKPPEPEPEPEVEAPPPEPPPAPQTWSMPVAVRELWVTLLPHFAWMIAVVMLTLAALLVIWGWRRLGRLSPEEEILLSQMSGAPADGPDGGAGGDDDPPDAATIPPTEDDFVREQRAYWANKLPADGPPDPDVRALIADWLRGGEMDLLAKAVLTFPEALPTAFPDGGEFAEPKHRFVEHLKTVSPDDLPSDGDFYARLRQHALSASLGQQADALSMATLRGGFGAAGLVGFVAKLPPRLGAVLFAHASLGDQMEASRLLSSRQVAGLAGQLLASNRMGPDESDFLLSLLEAARRGDPLPEPPAPPDVADLGSRFDAAASLSLLLPLLSAEARAELLRSARDRFGGQFPRWYDEILWPEVLEQLSPEDRADLFFEVDVAPLAGWLSMLPAATRERLLAGVSNRLQTALQASSTFESRDEQLERYRRGRLELAAALRQRLARASIPFESFVE